MFIFLLIFLAVLFLIFLSISETSLFSLSSFTIKMYATDKNTRKKIIAYLLERPSELLVTILILSVFFDILIQNMFSSFFKHSSWAIKIGIPLILTLFLGEILPKSVAFANNKKVAYKVAPFMSFLFKIIKPFRLFFTLVTEHASRAIFFFLKKEKPISLEELKYLLQTSQKSGILNIDEVELIEGCLKLQNTLVKEYMRPKEEIFFYDIDDNIANLMSIFTDKGYSRVPVCKHGLEKVLGIISLKRFFFGQSNIKNKEDLKKYLKKPFYVPESTSSWSLLSHLRDKNEDLALVVDEYGSISGIITQEDLVESVIGEIIDKKDKQKYNMSNDVVIASAQMDIKDLEDVFHVSLPRKGSSITIGGWLLDQMGEIPLAGTQFSTKDFFFYILASSSKKIEKIYIRRNQKDE
jgi:putative hemolysin